MKFRPLLLLGCLFLLIGATALVVVTHPEQDRRVFVSSVRSRLELWEQQSEELYQAKNFADAERRIRRVLDVEPENPDMLLLLAKIGYQQQRFQLAEECLRTLVRCQPEDSLALNNLAVVQLCAGKNASAREHIERALTLEPEDPFYLSNSAAILYASDAADEAGEALARSREQFARQSAVPDEDLFSVPPQFFPKQEKAK